MSSLITQIHTQPRRWIAIAAGVGATGWIIYLLTRRERPRSTSATRNLPASVLLKSITAGYDGLTYVLTTLEKILPELESRRYHSDVDRNRYQYFLSVLTRLRELVSDLHKFESGEITPQTPDTEIIARSVWNNVGGPKPTTTLSVLSDDSFLSANEDFLTPGAQESVSISVDHVTMQLYREGFTLAEEGKVPYRKSRADICGCESETDFAAKLWCLRQAFDTILADQSSRRVIIQSGRNIIADLLRQDRKDPKDFYVAYDKLMEFVENPNNYDQIQSELEQRKVACVNIWDVLIDFVLLDSFDDLRKPPSGVAALVKNSFLSRYMRESTLNNIIWSLIKAKRARLQVQNGFVSNFYDLAQVVSPTLTMGILGGSSKEFHELCLDFKENVMVLVVELFNRVRFTTLAELTEDVNKVLLSRLETLQVKLGSELLPA